VGPANSAAGDVMEEIADLVRTWAEPRLGSGTLAALWHGPGARGHDDPGADIQVCFVLSPEAFRNEWASGRRQVREVFRGRILRAAPCTYDEMAAWRWDPVLRFEFGTARTLYDAEGRLDTFLRAFVQVAAEQRRRETLDCYAALREGWHGLGRHAQRSDAETVAFLAPRAAEAGMRVYFALNEPGIPASTWLLPEFRRLAGPDWRRAVQPLVQPRGSAAEIRAAAATLVELARDRIHDAFHISRGALDAWSQTEKETGIG
jgi:hypothetical protein